MKTQLLLLFSLSTFVLCGQDLSDPVFANFVGDAYKMPILDTVNERGIKTKGFKTYYGDFVYDYKKIAALDLAELQIPETWDKKGSFPGIERKTGFAMVLHSKMSIVEKACYEFSLNSDDGSVLWVNEVMVVDNDGDHGMRVKRDSLVFDKGMYDVKVWYFQAYADRFGIELNAKALGLPEVCPSEEVFSGQPLSIAFGSKLFFESGKANLKAEAKVNLQELAELISSRNPKLVKIIGHTDDIGTAQYNSELSTQRAVNIMTELRGMITSSTKLLAIGKGEIEPKSSNESEEGRSLNRRVEILFEQ